MMIGLDDLFISLYLLILGLHLAFAFNNKAPKLLNINNKAPKTPNNEELKFEEWNWYHKIREEKNRYYAYFIFSIVFISNLVIFFNIYHLIINKDILFDTWRDSLYVFLLFFPMFFYAVINYYFVERKAVKEKSYKKQDLVSSIREIIIIMIFIVLMTLLSFLLRVIQFFYCRL